MSMRVADYIARHLERLGVSHVFWLTGGGMMHLMDAVARSTLKYVCHHHEQSCAYAADAFARRRGGLGVCYATSGPGATNTLTGMVTAYQDSTPVLFLTGQAKLSETIRGAGLAGLRQFGTFEVDMVPIVKSITKYAAFIDDPKSIRFHLEKAVHLATHGRPGPVLLDIPVDMQGALVESDALQGYTPEPPLPAPNDAAVQPVLDALLHAERPLWLAGYGVRAAQATDAFLTLVERLQVPVVTTQMAKDIMPYEHPLFVGHPGVKGDRAGGIAVQQADVLVTLGCSLHAMTTGYELQQFAPKARKMQIDIDDLVLKKENVGVHHKLRASVQDFIAAAHACLDARHGPHPPAQAGWRAMCQRWKSTLSVRHERHKNVDGQLNYYDVVEALNAHSRGDETFVADAGSAYYVMSQALRIKGTQRYIVCGSLGQMGYTTGAILGAAMAAPGQPIVGITGDGSLQTNLHDLALLRYHQPNIKLIVVNNRGYVSIRNTQNTYFNGLLAGTDEATGLYFPELAKLCQAYALPYAHAADKAALHHVMGQAFATRGPMVVEVATAYQQEILPSVSSVRLPDGRMRSRPLDDMFPFMSEEERARHGLGETP